MPTKNSLGMSRSSKFGSKIEWAYSAFENIIIIVHDPSFLLLAALFCVEGAHA